jgi:hypothetical protein
MWMNNTNINNFLLSDVYWMNNTNINNFLLSDVYSVKYFYGIVVDKTTTNTFYNKLHQIAYY